MNSPSTNNDKQARLAALLARARAAKNGTVATVIRKNESELNSLSNNTDSTNIGIDGSIISYNEKQLAFVQAMSSGESCVLIGAAGTGKTTCMRGATQALITSGRAGLLSTEGHKYLTKDGAPGIVVVSFTRRAVANIRKALADDMKSNCLTIHALLEYEPEYYTVIDEVTGEEKNTMKFIATRNENRPLPASIRCCIFEESSMISVELHKELIAALPSNCQLIFLGDIQQLPPVFGSAILGYKMLELPLTELTQVYRQALESPIIRLAHRILSGVPIPHKEYEEWKFPGKLTIHPWKKKLSADTALLTAAKFLTTAADSNLYNPENDMILIPFNKSFGTIELNKHLANHFAKKRKAIVHEVISGFNKHYFSVGDKIMYDKEDAVITGITKNVNYSGTSPQDCSESLDYWGYNSGNSVHHLSQEDTDPDLDFLLGQSAALDFNEERVRQASHILTIEVLDTGRVLALDTASAINLILLGYALTVHKSQGSEFKKVFLLLHQSHATMLQRELLYTAVTRAKEELYIICEPESLTNGILSQKIQGNTLAEKAEYFKGKISNQKGDLK